VDYHTILEADTVPSGCFDQIVGVPPREISYGEIPAGKAHYLLKPKVSLELTLTKLQVVVNDICRVYI
jgi:hypothetical protein